MTQQETKLDRFMIFRHTEEDKDKVSWLCEELEQGRLRQGWGAPGLSLTTEDGKYLNKEDWEAAYKKETDWGDPDPKRFAILRRMLELKRNDIVVLPKLPERNQFTIAQVSEGYRFDNVNGRDEFGHIIPVDARSIRKFAYRANDEAFLISALFSKTNHRQAVSFCYSEKCVEAACQLLNTDSNLVEKQPQELREAVMDDAFKAAAMSLAEIVKNWNAKIFEDAVLQCFISQGYKEREFLRYDREGADADMVLLPPRHRHDLSLPTEIAAQVKWKQGIDQNDVEAVRQIVKWARFTNSSATKYVISSASSFTEKAREEAEADGVVLIGGLQTMCFLLGVADRYREEWEPQES